MLIKQVITFIQSVISKEKYIENALGNVYIGYHESEEQNQWEKSLKYVYKGIGCGVGTNFFVALTKMEYNKILEIDEEMS